MSKDWSCNYTQEQIDVLKGLGPIRKRDEKSYTSIPAEVVELCSHCGEPHLSFQCWVNKTI